MEYTLQVAVDNYNLAVSTASYTVAIDSTIQVVSGTHYTGSYSFTPSDTAQTIPTGGLVLDSNITIAPIPSNYGLITWNGAVLTVS